MAVDLINANSTRYYSVPDSASLTFPDSDWFLAFWTRVDDNSGSFFQYIFSNNNFAVANSLNIFLQETGAGVPNIWRVTTSTFSQPSSLAPGGDSKDRLVIVQRNGSNLELWFCEAHSTATKEFDSVYSDGAINGGVWNIGRRVDGNTDRYYEEHFGDIIKGSVTISQSQIELIARGVPITQIIDPSKIDVWFQFREASSQVVDIINGNIATRQGSGLLTSEHFPLIGNIISVISSIAAATAASLLLIQQSFRQ